MLPDLVDGEAAACIPTCGAGRVAGGELPAGRYQTKVFFGGYMTVESDGSWPLSEDSNGELSLLVSDNYRIAFMLDIQLVTDDGVADVPPAAAAYVHWLRRHPELIVSEPMTTTIGSTREPSR